MSPLLGRSAVSGALTHSGGWRNGMSSPTRTITHRRRRALQQQHHQTHRGSQVRRRCRQHISITKHISIIKHIADPMFMDSGKAGRREGGKAGRREGGKVGRRVGVEC